MIDSGKSIEKAIDELVGKKINKNHLLIDLILNFNYSNIEALNIIKKLNIKSDSIKSNNITIINDNSSTEMLNINNDTSNIINNENITIINDDIIINNENITIVDSNSTKNNIENMINSQININDDL